MPRKRTKPYPGSISKRGAGVWRVRFCVGGERHRFTVKGTKVEAQNFAVTKHAEISKDHGRAEAGMPGPIRFSALLDEFTEGRMPGLKSDGTRKSYANSFKAFRPFFVEKNGDPFVRDIGRRLIVKFIEWRPTFRVGDKTGTGSVSLHTVRRDRRVLSLLFTYAYKLEYIDSNPCYKIDADKPDARDVPLLTKNELRDFLNATIENPMLHMLVLLLAESGVRFYTEALQLRWSDVDFANGRIDVVHDPKSRNGRRIKGGRSRSIKMTDTLRDALREHAAAYRLATYNGERSPFVFHHLHMTRSAVAGAQITDMRGSFDTAKKAAKLPATFRPHDLRHRYISRRVNGGDSLVDVQREAGHAQITTTMGYVHEDVRQKLEAEKEAEHAAHAARG